MIDWACHIKKYFKSDWSKLHGANVYHGMQIFVDSLNLMYCPDTHMDALQNIWVVYFQHGWNFGEMTVHFGTKCDDMKSGIAVLLCLD